MPLIPRESCQIIPTPLSDHNICKISLLAPNGEINHKSYWRFNPRLLQYEGFQNAIKNIINNSNLTAPNADSPDTEHFAHFGKLKYKLRTLSRNSAIGRSRNLNKILCDTQNEIIDLELLPRTQTHLQGLLYSISNSRKLMNNCQPRPILKLQYHVLRTLNDLLNHSST